MEDSLNELFFALSKAQGEFTPVKTDCNVDFTTKVGRRIKYSYASFAAIFNMAHKPLSDNELCVIQVTKDNKLITTLGHSSGQSVQSEKNLGSHTNDPKSDAATESYHRRYQYRAICGIVTIAEDNEDFVDGNNETQPQTVNNQAPKKPTPKPAPPKAENATRHYPERNHLDDMFDDIQGRVDNYFDHKAHLFSVLGEWPKKDDEKAIWIAVQKAISHVSNKADIKASNEE